MANAHVIDGHNDMPWAVREAFGLDLSRWSTQDLEALAHGNVLRASRDVADAATD